MAVPGMNGVILSEAKNPRICLCLFSGYSHYETAVAILGSRSSGAIPKI